MKRSGLITVPAVCVFILASMFSMELRGISSSSNGNSQENPGKITDKKIPLNLISPNGEEVLHPGEKFLITWESDRDIEKVKLEYSPDNGTSFQPIVDNIPNTGSYEWQVPYHISSNSLVRVSKADKKKMLPHQVSYELKFKISGGESLTNSGKIFSISLGDENEKANGYAFNELSFSTRINGKAYICFNDFVKEIGPFNQFHNRWHDVQVFRDSIYDNFSITLDGTLIFENIHDSPNVYFLWAVSFSIGPTHSNVELDDVVVRGLYKSYNNNQFVTIFKEDFERFVDGKITMDSGWTKSILKPPDEIQFEGEANDCLSINQDSDSGLRTLNVRSEQGSQVILVKSFDVSQNIIYDISDNFFYIREMADMNRDALVQNQMKGSPGQSSQGTFANGFSSTPPTLSGNSRPGLSRPTEMINNYYIYTFDGKLLAEYDHNGNCVRDFIYFGDRLIAEYRPQTNKYYYYMTDQVNSTRIITDENGNVVFSEAYGPYGDVQKTWVNSYEPKLKFSGKEREGYSDLDYFGARYYDHKSYRFNSVDPVITREEALYNPQLWNLYAFSRNNPVTFFDPDGRDIVKYDLELGMWESDPGYGEAKSEQEKQQLRQILTNLSLSAMSGMMLMLPPVVATAPPPFFGTGPKNVLKTPKWVKDSNAFVNWMKNIQKSGVTLTKAQADKIVKQAKKFGVKVRLDKPHTKTNWDVPHLNIGKKGQAHIRVPEGYKLPD